MAPELTKAIHMVCPVMGRDPMVCISRAIACTTKNIKAAIRPSETDTRGGGDAEGSSR